VSAVVFPMLVAAVFAVVASVLVTGALHEDALADAVDGLGGGRTTERALEIMKDSRVGAYGVVAIALSIVARVAALGSIGSAGVGAVMAALVSAHALARWSSVLLIRSLPYVRSGGAVSPFVDVSSTHVFAATAITIVLAVTAMRWRGLAAVMAGVLVTLGARWYFRRRLGGMTGDCLGATNQIVELTTYLVFAARI
jgi:adenosylcobinamide-GDP ribazoletransferase